MEEISDNLAYKDYITNFSHELNYKNIFEEKLKSNQFSHNFKEHDKSIYILHLLNEKKRGHINKLIYILIFI